MNPSCSYLDRLISTSCATIRHSMMNPKSPKQYSKLMSDGLEP